GGRNSREASQGGRRRGGGQKRSIARRSGRGVCRAQRTKSKVRRVANLLPRSGSGSIQNPARDHFHQRIATIPDRQSAQAGADRKSQRRRRLIPRRTKFITSLECPAEHLERCPSG